MKRSDFQTLMGRPSDTDLNMWFCLAVQIDQSHAADEAFQALHKLAYITSTLLTWKLQCFPETSFVCASCTLPPCQETQFPWISMQQGRWRPSQMCADTVEKLDTGQRTANATSIFVIWITERFRSSSRIGWLLETLLKWMLRRMMKSPIA